MEETTVQETVTSVVSMSDKLQGAIGDLITKSLDLAEVSGEFLVNEIPDVVYQLMLWHGVKSGIICLAGLLSLVAAIYINYRIIKSITNYTHNGEVGTTVFLKYGNDPDFVIRFVPFVAINILGVITILNTINIEWLQIWIAPKVWLLEYAGNFIK